ncbi:MAG: hypothetical protein ACK4SX_14035 [Alcanivoracaceae bacterium]
MNLSRHIRLCAAALSVLCAAAAHGSECTSPVMLGEKPAMVTYGDYSDFLVAVMEHKSREEEKRRHQKLCPELYREAPTEPSQIESLEGAIRRSAGQPPFDYSANQSWYNRSTSRSFALPGMPNSLMASLALGTPLDTQAMSPEAQRLLAAVLASLGTDENLEDGSKSLGLSHEMIFRLLPQREADVVIAAMAGSFGSRLTDVAFSDDGSLTLYLGGSGFLKIHAQIEVENCLSSCGEFGIWIGYQ